MLTIVGKLLRFPTFRIQLLGLSRVTYLDLLKGADLRPLEAMFSTQFSTPLHLHGLQPVAVRDDAKVGTPCCCMTCGKGALFRQRLSTSPERCAILGIGPGETRTDKAGKIAATVQQYRASTQAHFYVRNAMCSFSRTCL